jgi:hypothetical protein
MRVMFTETRCQTYQWAAAIAGEIDPKLGWGTEELIGGECIAVLEAAEDAQGTENNKVVKVKPPKKGKTLGDGPARKSDDPEGDVVQIPL